MEAIETGMGVAWLKAAGMLYPPEKRLFEDRYMDQLNLNLKGFEIGRLVLAEVNK